MRGKVYSDDVLSLSRISKSDNDIAKRILSYASGDSVCLPSEEVSKGFKDAMKAIFSQKGSSFSIDIMADGNVQKLIEAHTDVLNRNIERLEMSDLMRQRLTRSNYIFSGMKTFHELNEAFPSLLDENGDRKPFERFLNDVRKIDETYNSNYLRAEYNFVQASAEMAAKWEQYSEDGDRYLLQYRTAHDDKVRPEHAALDRITLPMSDPFWESYYPPLSWNCRCSVVQVRRGKYEETPHNEAMSRGEEAFANNEKLNMFRFNSGIQGKTMPDYNPYTIKRCNDCDVAKGKLGLVNEIVDNQLCAACSLLHSMKVEGERRRLSSEERKTVLKSALTWADKHLPRTIMSDGKEAARLTVQTKEGIELHIGKKFFTETFSKCKNSRRVAETMEMATLVNEWIRDSEKTRKEPGRHHDFDFVVFKAKYQNQEIEFKAKSTEGLIVYTMRLI